MDNPSVLRQGPNTAIICVVPGSLSMMATSECPPSLEARCCCGNASSSIAARPSIDGMRLAS